MLPFVLTKEKNECGKLCERMLLSCRFEWQGYRFGYFCANGTPWPVELAGLDALTGPPRAGTRVARPSCVIKEKVARK
jgi:hypothetical protein